MTTNAKTTVFNLVILDESGSMGCVKKQTLSGCNEIIDSIKSADKENSRDVRSLISIYAFQDNPSCPSHYIIKNCKAEDARHITAKQYNPWGSTPLYDAVGETLSELKAIVETYEDATAVVTIITDGEENSSRRWTGAKVARLISQLKEQGWTINLIGANIDVEEMARTICIDTDNAMAFEQTEEDTEAMYACFAEKSKQAYSCRVQERQIADPTERLKARKANAKGFMK